MPLTLLVLLAASLNPPATAQLHTRRFKIVHTERAAEAAKLLAAEVEARRDQIQALLGRDWEGVTEVRLGWNRDELIALAPTPPPSWAVALAWPEQNLVLVEAKSLVQGDGQQTLKHELIHVALGRLGPRWPRWFQEGLAQHLTGERRFSVEHYTTLARAVSAERVFKLDDLTEGFPNLPGDVEIAYAQSAAFIDFLTERHEREAFGQLVDGVGRGETFELAFAKAFHTSLNLEERIFREQLPARYPYWPIITTGTSLWALAAGLVVLGFWRRRRAVALLRAQQEELEAAEDAAARIVAAEQQRALEPEVAPPAPPGAPEPKPTLH